MEKLYGPYGGPRNLFTIPLKDSHLFKIAESVISFCLKKNYDLAILNRWESFSGMVDYVTCPPWEPYNFSMCKAHAAIWVRIFKIELFFEVVWNYVLKFGIVI